ncbi:nitroreductase [Amycolatopsis acidicola]|uniref:Nitroreductase n=1 Tax=Amycolatopsis acidicola TaxID=2596893 RepID=A0A5N0V7M1_9PSEU|nr:nitroreductase [Amycolatopsis acidicola]KAA9160502.1 nitroreductase [Amycolatopsis acidicola]
MSTTDTRAPATGDTESLARLLDGRWSCRGFRPSPVPRERITRVLDIARQAPSWCNTQPWHVLITEGEGTERFRAALSAHAATAELTPDFPFPESYSGEYLRRRRECGFQLYDSVGIAKGDREASALQAAKNFELFGAPHAAIITTEAELGVYGAVDCGVYLETFLLAAQSLGLGAIPQAALGAYAPFIREFFGLPENRLVVCGVSFGWPDRDHPANGFRTTRVGVEETVTWVG